LGSDHEHQQKYFAALKCYERTFIKCFDKFLVSPDIEIPKTAKHMLVLRHWQVEAYKKPAVCQISGFEDRLI